MTNLYRKSSAVEVIEMLGGWFKSIIKWLAIGAGTAGVLYGVYWLVVVWELPPGPVCYSIAGYDANGKLVCSLPKCVRDDNYGKDGYRYSNGNNTVYIIIANHIDTVRVK